MTRLRLAPATETLLSSLARSAEEFARLIGSPVPPGWPEFPEAISHTLTRLQEAPADSAWWMYFFIDAESGLLVGSGGFAGPPVDGVVEIGYEIAPTFRRRGYATAAARELVHLAARSGSVTEVVAHTLRGDERSPGVLRAAGFERSEVLLDPEHGEIDRWRRGSCASRRS